MSDVDDKNDELDGGPGAAYQPFVVMEELLEKLKLLNYEDGYCRQLSHKPISRHYFALPTNSGEQFFAFATLSAWLLKSCGKNFEQPQEQDSPNTVISSILDELKKMDHKPDFPNSRLKAGSGEQCLWVLNKLADEALRIKNFAWKKPVYPQEEAEESQMIDDDDADLNLLNGENDVLADEYDDDVDDDRHMLILDNFGGNPLLSTTTDANNSNAFLGMGDSKSASTLNFSGSRPERVLESSTDAAEWKLEVERVLPQLKVTIRPDNKDWRVHFDQMQQYRTTIDGSLQETKSQLERLSRDISKSLDKISSREKYINNQLDGKLQNFRVMQDHLTEVKEQYKQASVGVSERSKALAEITDDLERVKQEIEERGSSMSDGTHLVKIKQSMVKLKEECLQMDIRIGVLQHILLRAKLKEKSLNLASSRNQTIIIDDDDDNEFQGY